jgi:endonuclease/exonuclease/phosphatase family metal-dependent hydrolase
LRKEKVINLIREQQPLVFGLQEALIGQIKDIQGEMPGFGWVGAGRDDGKEGGEFTPVFFDQSRFQLKNTSTFWLSPTPGTPGTKGWDAACNRIVTWALFEDRNTLKEFYFFNTHFDHVGHLARRNSSFLLADAIDSLAGNLPVILTGDFNVVPNSEPVMILTFRNKPWKILQDTRSLTSDRTGQIVTYTGFEVGAIEGKLIDFIFVKKIKQVYWHRIPDNSDGKYYPSDHLPVVVKMSLTP